MIIVKHATKFEVYKTITVNYTTWKIVRIQTLYHHRLFQLRRWQRVSSCIKDRLAELTMPTRSFRLTSPRRALMPTLLHGLPTLST